MILGMVTVVMGGMGTVGKVAMVVVWNAGIDGTPSTFSWVTVAGGLLRFRIQFYREKTGRHISHLNPDRSFAYSATEFISAIY